MLIDACEKRFSVSFQTSREALEKLEETLPED
jgi:hypothetical protein